LGRLEGALLGFVIYGAFEGLLKRLTGYAWYVYPVKDLFFFCMLAIWISTPREHGVRSRPPLSFVLWTYLIIVGFQVFNPYLPSVIAGLVGIKASYMYAIVYFVVFRALDTESRVKRLARWVGGLAVLTAVGAMAESSLGLEWVYENKVQVMINATYMGISGNWVLRPSSIGNGPGSAAMMEFIGAGLLLGLAAIEKRKVYRYLLLAGAALALGGILLAATRIIWVQTAIAAAAFVLLIGRRRIRWGISILVLVALAWQLSLFFSGKEIVARFQTLQTPTETYRNERLGSLLLLPEVISKYPLGAGVGWNVPRKDLVEGSYAGEQVQFLGVHNYFSILALEVGVLGLLIFAIFSLGVLLFGLQSIKCERDEDRRALLTACYAAFSGIALSFPFGGGIIGWPGEYYWILAAIVLRLGQRRAASRQYPKVARASLGRL
jgi:hypothetical protein